MAKRGIEDTFELSFFTKGAAARGIRLYDSMGYTKVSVREADGMVWVTFRESGERPTSS